jgi:hypothetical protein
MRIEIFVETGNNLKKLKEKEIKLENNFSVNSKTEKNEKIHETSKKITNLFINMMNNGIFKTNRIKSYFKHTDGKDENTHEKDHYVYIKNLLLDEKIKELSYEKIIDHLMNQDVETINYETDMQCLQYLYLKSMDEKDLLSVKDVFLIFGKILEKVFYKIIKREEKRRLKKE